MDIRRNIPAEVIAAATGVLLPWIPGLTPTRHEAAIRAFDPETEGSTRDAAPLSPMLSMEQVAAVLNVHIDTIRRMVKDGRLPGCKIGSLWRIPAAAVKALAETGEV